MVVTVTVTVVWARAVRLKRLVRITELRTSQSSVALTDLDEQRCRIHGWTKLRSLDEL